MTWFRLAFASTIRLQPQLSSFRRSFGAWEQRLQDHSRSRRHGLARWRRASRRTARAALEQLAASSELASLAFFVILIVLTFLI